jgi:co-chaperonin GroES (HSP10)
MENQSITKVNVNTENIQETTNELQNLGSELNGKAGFIQKKETILARHIEDLATTNKTWLDRLMLPKEDKMMLKVYAEKQQEAVGIILSNQNKSLAAICGGQVTFVKEVVNTLLKTGRAGLKAGADVIFTEYRNQRAVKMEKLANDFYNLIEVKLADAEKRTQKLQDMKLREVDIDLQKWEEDYKLLQDEFSNILREQV